MRKQIAIVTALLVIAAALIIINLPNYTGNVVLTTFTTGEPTKKIVFNGAGWDNTTYINVPQGADIFYAYVVLHPISINGSYPTNVKIDVGGNGVDWEYKGAMVTDQKVRIDQYIGSMRGEIPIHIYSGSSGEIILENLEVNYAIPVQQQSTNTQTVQETIVQPKPTVKSFETKEVNSQTATFYDNFSNTNNVDQTLSSGVTISNGVTVQSTTQTSAIYSGFKYRLPINVSNPNSENLTDFQVLLKIPKSNLNCSSSTYADIRFSYVYPNGTEVRIPYWIDNLQTSSTTLGVWVKVPYLPANGNASLYAYCYNSTATSESNGSAVFIFFDNFETWSGWYTYLSGVLAQSTAYKVDGSYSAYKGNNGDPNGGYKLIGVTLNRNTPFVVEAYVLRPGSTSTSLWDRFGIVDSNGNGYGFAERLDISGVGLDIRSSYSGNLNYGTYSTIISTGAWHLCSLIVTPTWVASVIYTPTGALDGKYNSTDTTYSTFDRVYIFGGYPYYVDDLKIRKYAPQDPQATFGTLENVSTTSTTNNYGIIYSVPIGVGQNVTSLNSLAVNLSGSAKFYVTSNDTKTKILIGSATGPTTFNLSNISISAPFRLMANISSGTLYSWNLSYNYFVDSTPPTISGVTQSVEVGNPITFHVSDNVAVDSCWVSNNGINTTGTISNGTCSVSLNLGPGSYSVQLCANDTTGNTACIPSTIEIYGLVSNETMSINQSGMYYVSQDMSSLEVTAESTIDFQKHTAGKIVALNTTLIKNMKIKDAIANISAYGVNITKVNSIPSHPSGLLPIEMLYVKNNTNGAYIQLNITYRSTLFKDIQVWKYEDNGTWIKLNVQKIGDKYILPNITSFSTITLLGVLSSDWNSYGHDVQRTFSTSAYVNGTQLVWQLPYTVSSVVANGLCYLSSTEIYAVNCTNGNLIWSYPATATNLAYDSGKLYASDGTTLYVLNATTGGLISSTSVSSYNFVVYNGTLYYLYNGIIYSNGTYTWNASLNLTPYLLYNDYLIVSNGSFIETVNATNGSQIWNTTYQANKFSAYNDMLLAYSSNGLAAIYISNGTIAWNNTYSVSGLAVKDNVVYASVINSTSTVLYEFNLTTGSTINSFTFANTSSNAVLIDNNSLVYLSNTSNTFAVNSTGSIVATYPSTANASEYAIYDGKLIIGNSAYGIDNLAPKVEINYPLSQTYPTVTVINVSVNDYKPNGLGISSVIANLDGTTNITLTHVAGTDYFMNNSVNIPAGSHTITIYATDVYGNLNDTQSVSFNVTGLSAAPSNYTWYSEAYNRTLSGYYPINTPYGYQPYVNITATPIGYVVVNTTNAGIAIIYATQNSLVGYSLTQNSLLWSNSITNVSDKIYFDGEDIYVPTTTGNLLIYNVGGALVNNISVTTASLGMPVVSNGIAYVKSSSTLFAVNLSSGSQIWNYTCTGTMTNPTVGDAVYFACINSNSSYANFTVYKLSTSGALLGSYSYTLFDSAITGTTLIASNITEVAYNNGLIAISAHEWDSSSATLRNYLRDYIFVLNSTTMAQAFNYSIYNSWTSPAIISTTSPAKPAISNDRIYWLTTKGLFVFNYTGNLLLGDSTAASLEKPKFVIVSNSTIYQSGTMLTALKTSNYQKTFEYPYTVTDAALFNEYLVMTDANGIAVYIKDTTPPNVGIIYPQPTTYNQSITLVNSTITDTSIVSGIANVDNSTNYTLTQQSGTNYFYNNSLDISIPGLHTVKVYGVDSQGNINYTGVTFNVVIPLLLNYVAPTPNNGSIVLAGSQVTINVSANTQLSNCTLYANGANYSMTVNGTYCYITLNPTVDLHYYVNASVLSTNGTPIYNTTSERTLYVIGCPTGYTGVVVRTNVSSVKAGYPVKVFGTYCVNGVPTTSNYKMYLNSTPYGTNVTVFDNSTFDNLPKPYLLMNNTDWLTVMNGWQVTDFFTQVYPTWCADNIYLCKFREGDLSNFSIKSYAGGSYAKIYKIYPNVSATDFNIAMNIPNYTKTSTFVSVNFVLQNGITLHYVMFTYDFLTQSFYQPLPASNSTDIYIDYRNVSRPHLNGWYVYNFPILVDELTHGFISNLSEIDVYTSYGLTTSGVNIKVDNINLTSTKGMYSNGAIFYYTFNAPNKLGNANVTVYAYNSTSINENKTTIKIIQPAMVTLNVTPHVLPVGEAINVSGIAKYYSGEPLPNGTPAYILLDNYPTIEHTSLTKLTFDNSTEGWHIIYGNPVSSRNISIINKTLYAEDNHTVTSWISFNLRIDKYIPSEWIDGINFSIKTDATNYSYMYIYLKVGVDNNGYEKDFYYLLYNTSTFSNPHRWVPITLGTWNNITINSIYSDLNAVSNGKKITRLEFIMSGHISGVLRGYIQLDNFTMSKSGSTFLGTNGNYSYSFVPPAGTHFVGVDVIDPKTGYDIKNQTIIQVGNMSLRVSPANGTFVSTNYITLHLDTAPSLMNHVKIYVDGVLEKEISLNDYVSTYDVTIPLNSSGTHVITVNASNPVAAAVNSTSVYVLLPGQLNMYYAINGVLNSTFNTSGEIYNLSVFAKNGTNYQPNLTICLELHGGLITSKGESTTRICLPEDLAGKVEFLTIPIGGVQLSFIGLSYYKQYFDSLLANETIFNSVLKMPPSTVTCHYVLTSTQTSQITNPLQIHYDDLITAVKMARLEQGYLINVTNTSISSTKYYGGVPTIFNFSLPVGSKVVIKGRNMLTLSTLQANSNTTIELNITSDPEYLTIVPTSPPAGEQANITVYIYNQSNVLVNQYTLTFTTGTYYNTNGIIGLSNITNIIDKFYATNAYSIKYLRVCGG